MKDGAEMSDAPAILVTTPNNLAQLLKNTHRLAEAESLMRRALSIFLDFTRRTGYEHPHLSTAKDNYEGILKALGQSEEDIDAALRKLFEEHGLIFERTS